MTNDDSDIRMRNSFHPYLNAADRHALIEHDRKLLKDFAEHCNNLGRPWNWIVEIESFLSNSCRSCIHGNVHPMETCKYCSETGKLINNNTPSCDKYERYKL